MDWILEVLRDLTDFARANDMPVLASKADEAMRAAEAEIAAQNRKGDTPDQQGNLH